MCARQGCCHWSCFSRGHAEHHPWAQLSWMGQHTRAHHGVSGSETVVLQAVTNLRDHRGKASSLVLLLRYWCLRFRELNHLPHCSLLRGQPEPHAQGQGKSRARQVFEAADPGLPHRSLSCKFLWIYPRLQINAGWGPLSRPSPSCCSCGFHWYKEAP